MVLGIAPVAIIDRQLPFEYTITSRSTDVVVPCPPAPTADSAANVLTEWKAIYDAYNEVACLMLGSMTPELHRQFENYSPYDMLCELKSMFKKQARAAANMVKSRYENSIMGFFVGKDPSFPVVQNYVMNTWNKFGFEKITRNDDGVYLFKFASKTGMEQVLEKGPWIIRKSPIILNKWTSSVSLRKGEVTKVPVWVKLYNVPVLAYSEDGLSLIATQIGKPIMLDAFTSSMCVESWGRINFARALIEICSHSTLKKEVTMAIPEDEGDGHIKEVIRVEYEWKPPHCVDCKSFGHGPNLCPKRVREDIPKAPSMAAKSSTMEENEEGFVEVKSRKKNKGAAPRSFGGLRLPKPNSKVIWQQKKSVGSKGGSNAASPSGFTNENEKGDGGKSSQFCAKPELNTKVSNAFEVLNVVGEDVCDSNVQEPKVSEHIGTSSSNLDKEEVQEEGLWSRFKKAKENAKSKYSELEDDSDEDEVYMPHGGGGMDGLEDDLDCYDDYGTQMYDISPQEQAFCDQFDIRLNSRGGK
ncbi:reverse transcriptase domain-containing protein [Tanacetum coccineum]